MIVIVGSKGLWPTPALASTILSIIISTDAPVGVRFRVGVETSMTETLANKIANRVGREVSVWKVSPSDGSAAGFLRDIRMVTEASHVYAFFGPGEEMTGGTGHVVEVALRRGVPVTAYHLDPTGNVVEFASEEALA